MKKLIIILLTVSCFQVFGASIQAKSEGTEMDYNAFEDLILSTFQTELTGDIKTFRKGLPEKIILGEYEATELPVLIVQSKIVAGPSGMSTVSEIERIEPVQLLCILSGTDREVVRQSGNNIISKIEGVADKHRGNTGAFGLNRFVYSFDNDVVQMVQDGERWFAVLQPSMVIKCYEEV